MVVNISVLVFLGYAVFRSDGPVWNAFREYSDTRERNAIIEGLLEERGGERHLANGNPPVVVAFIDFQCSYCRSMHETLRIAEAEPELDIIMVHLPLAVIHPLAVPAAITSICAEAQGYGSIVNALLLSTSNWINDSDWGLLAREAGISDLEKFEECLIAQDTRRELSRHMDIAARLGIKATPTFVSYGGVHRGIATLDELLELTRE